MKADEKQGKYREKTFWRPTIRSYLIFMNMVLLCLLFPSISYFFLHEVAEFRDAQLERNIRRMRDSLETRSASLARGMALSAGQAIDRYDFTFLNQIVDRVSSNDPEIVNCILMDKNNKAVVHSDPNKLGSDIDGPNFEKAFPPEKNDSDMDIVKFVYEETKGPDEIMEAVAPVYIAGRFWGVLRCGYSLKALHGEIQSTRQDWENKMGQFEAWLVSMTFIFFSFGAVVAALFTRSFVRSMHVLNDGVQRVSNGNLDHEIQQRGLVCEEFMKLSGAFNMMTDRLRTLYRQLDEYNRSLEQKVAERTRELREAQDNLIQQAHEAGMAEMAVGILHNIGNAITPAKVGAALLINFLKGSAVRKNIGEAAERIGTALSAASGIEENERERLFALVELIPKSIAEEYDKTIAEIQQIRDKHEHIESIISLQMRYARVHGDPEEVDINLLAEDALKMMDESIRKRSVNIVRNFSHVPRVRIEQAKLIQIFVNLIKNGFEALEKVDSENKELVIATLHEKDPAPIVEISVTDSGIGFSPEEKKNLFTFGYSTKSKGSGFGLHSCANYLIAKNGSISAHSDGKGKGAKFVVRLPATQ